MLFLAIDLGRVIASGIRVNDAIANLQKEMEIGLALDNSISIEAHEIATAAIISDARADGRTIAHLLVNLK